MISTQHYRRRMASLARAEAVRGHDGGAVSAFAKVALARRCAAEPSRGGVDPVAASRVAVPFLLRG